MTTQNMLSSLMASPIDVRRAQAAKTQQDAMNLANADPYAASKYMMGMAGAGLAAPLAGALGMQNAEEVEARAIQNIQTQIDHSSSEGLMKGVEALNQAGNPKLAQLYYEAALKAREVEIANQNANTRVDELNQKAPTTINTENEQGSKLTRQWNPKTRTWDVVDIGQSNAAKENERRFSPYAGRSRFDINAELTPEQMETAEYYAEMHLNGDDSWIAGMSRNPVMKNRVMQLVAEKAQEQGISATDLSQRIIDFKSKEVASKQFANPNSAERVRISAFNTALNHLVTFAHSVKQLDNGQIQLFNYAGNKVDEWRGVAAPTNVDAIVKILSKELTRAFTGPLSSSKERIAMEGVLSRVKSPEQLEGAIRQMEELLVGQLDTSRRNYEKLTGRNDFNDYLSDYSVTVLNQVNAETAARDALAAPAGQQVDRRSEYEAWKAQQGMK